MKSERHPASPGAGANLGSQRADLLQAVIADSPLGIIVSDPEGLVEIWNPAAERIFGWRADEVIGRPDPTVPIEHRAEHRALRSSALRGEQVSGREVWRRRKDGSAVCLSLSVSGLLDDQGEVAGVIGLMADRTEHRRALDEKARLEEQLRQSQKMEAIGRLAGGLAHDMNNVLQTVLAIGELMQRVIEPESPNQQLLLELISACARGRDLTRDLLSFARKEPIQHQAIVLNALIERVRSLIRRLVPRAVAIQTHYAPDLVPVEGDPGQLTHALINLCINAADAIEGTGVVTISTANVDLAAGALVGHDGAPVRPGPYVRLEVRDTGSGMDETVRARAFEPFFTTKPEGAGTGLGLSIVQSTISSHGGHVTIESSRGQGTAVSILLPTAAATAARREVAATDQAPDGPGDRERVATARRVLLVDDEEIILRSWRRLLENIGFEVLVAHHGEEALAALSRARGAVDLVVLDMVMPVMDGFETFQRLQELYPELPVLIASGHLQDEQASALIEQGAVGFLPKPFDIEQLTRVLVRVAGG